jgi:GNAT superfamily N-acetyltransferase
MALLARSSTVAPYNEIESPSCIAHFLIDVNDDPMTQIRPAQPADIPLILELIRELALYEREPAAVVATEADLMRDGFGPTPRYECLIAESEGQPAGFALYFFNYSTWRGRAGIHLEDLFVRPAFRGLGIGKALLARVAAITVERKLGRLQWEVLDWNQPAIDFYQRLGAEFLHEWRIMRVTDAALAALAGPPRLASPFLSVSAHSEESQ